MTVRPLRDADPKRNAAYWERIDRVVSEAPPLSDAQRAKLRVLFSQSAATTEQ